MDNNTTPPNDNDLNKPSDMDGSGGIYTSEPESLGKGNTPIFIGAGALVVGALYIFYSMFSAPEPPKQESPSNPTTKGTVAGGTDVPKIDSVLGGPAGDLPPPPITSIAPPPPPIAVPSFTAPPVVSLPPKTVVNIPTGSGSLSSEPLPPPPPPPPSLSSPTSNADGSGSKSAGGEKDQRRLRANMLLLDGGKDGGQGSSDSGRTGYSSSDPNSAFYNTTVSATKAEKVSATALSNLGMTIAQGKIIDATLESAINTELPSPLRAIVSRDVYSESGRNVLIPKGSRLIGTYNTNVSTGQSRVMIVWTRLIRPDGIDIQIGSPTVDNLGRGGLEGFLDSKFSEIFSAAILTSALTIAGAVAVDEILPTNQQTTTTTPEGNQTTNATAAQQASGEALRNLADTGKDVVSKLINVNPTIIIDQGTPFNVFVNKDLTFPTDMSGSMFVR